MNELVYAAQHIGFNSRVGGAAASVDAALFEKDSLCSSQAAQLLRLGATNGPPRGPSQGSLTKGSHLMNTCGLLPRLGAR